MSHSYCIRTSLDLKDENIHFEEDFCKEIKIKGKRSKMYYGKLTYTPIRCANCGTEKEGHSIIKYGFKTSRITLNSVSHFPTYLSLKKQRFFCKYCQTTFIAESKEVDRYCYISNLVKQSIAIESKDKISEKDLAKRHHVSPTTTSRVIKALGRQFKLNYQYLPNHLSFDEFQSVARKMSFTYINSKSHQLIDVLPDRRLDTLRSHFLNYSYQTRNKVKTIVIDMNTPYMTLIKELFGNADIIVDPFHLVQLVSRSLNQTRIKLMNQYRTSNPEDLKKYRKLKRYWRLILKAETKLSATHYSYHRLFKGMKSQKGVVDYLLSLGEEFRITYEFYQRLLYAFDKKDYNYFVHCLNTAPDGLSSYMNTSLKTLKKYQKYVKNTFIYPYTNGPIEGINNKIKVIKRIAFGFRNFSKFKTRILISCNTIQK